MRIALLIPLALLAACMPDNRSVNTMKAPEIARSSFAFDVRFSDTDSLPADQAAALEQWLGAVGVAYGDRIGVDDPIAAGAVSRRAAIAGVVARFGLLVQDTAPVTAALPAGTARVVITRTQVSVPDCPDWRRPSNPTTGNSSMSNYGCASVSNLAAMIADPNDLIDGQTYTGADGHTTSKAINVYRERKPTGTGKLPKSDIATTGN
ncbi:CpaD family pilus assembly protein [Sphingoaurantiacus capsulatus]|uniref:CpaD family pilus assembly protein n=1 Tax=Sphingoaurantiacus capsulatus TaxID=1771310 RepID=A0ABV7X918_9SPHN